MIRRLLARHRSRAVGPVSNGAVRQGDAASDTETWVCEAGRLRVRSVA